MNSFVVSKEEDYQKAIEHFQKDISTLRSGRANAAILDGVFVNAYGAKSPLNAMSSISVEDARSMIVSPWDKSVMKDIEKGIVEANLGVSVVNEGDKIRVGIPQMTEENRKNLVKQLNEKIEHAKIAIRQIRDEIKKEIEASFKEKEVTEDDKFRFLQEMEKKNHDIIEEIENIGGKKEKDIMSI